MAYPIRAGAEYIPLSDKEISSFFEDLDKDKDGFITFDELEAKLHDVHKELAPEPQKHHLNHPSRLEDTEKGDSHSGRGLHAFLCTLMPDCGARISREDFAQHVKTWELPSQDQSELEDNRKKGYGYKHSFWRKAKAYWAVNGAKIAVLSFVVALQLAFGLWQLVKYIKNREARAALGWGVILAKGSAGVLYPTFFFMLLSMSRHFSTLVRKNHFISKFVNWDLSQSFHVKMCIVGLGFATLHAIGHLTGTFLYGSRPAQQDDLAVLLGPGAVPKPYRKFVSTLPGWSGIVSFALFWTMSLLSMPFIRKKHYEIFQLGHLLMFPLIGLLCAHGTAALLQTPMLGYWLAFPALLIIIERLFRLYRGMLKIPAQVEFLDDDTVCITCTHPRREPWRYEAGQYLLLQVPSISYFQWHPFTISACRGEILQVHIKHDGNWTNKLRELPEGKDIRVGIDGPFGAPAQQFYAYDHAVIIGAGIGVTPFSAILTDLEQRLQNKTDPWALKEKHAWRAESPSRRASSDTTVVDPLNPSLTPKTSTLLHKPSPSHRVDFHWMVREKNYLLWFSDLLNRAIAGAPKAKNLTLNINTHITMKRKNISTHVFRYLLDSYRTSTEPYSALTGLKTDSQFGRPDFNDILERFHADMKEAGVRDCKVGVFYCGTPVVGMIISDRCARLTAKARSDGSRIKYRFMMEVFG